MVFDQSIFVKNAIETLLHEGAIGLFLTSLMILIFLGSIRATVAVCLSIPLSALATFLVLALGGSSVNAMVLGGLALVFSRLIDNSVVVLENIYRHLENGVPAPEAAERGGQEVALPVLAATLTTGVVFFPVTFLYGVSRFLFSALALAVVIALFASYFVAMTVVPLFCARFLKSPHDTGAPARPPGHGVAGSTSGSTATSTGCCDGYTRLVGAALRRPVTVIVGSAAVFAASLLLYPRLGVAFFPSTDAGQFVINLKAPPGTRLEIDVRRDGAGRTAGPTGGGAGGPRHDRVEHRRRTRVLLDLHQQLRAAHGVRAGEPAGGPQDRQLRVHESHAAGAWRRNCRS